MIQQVKSYDVISSWWGGTDLFWPITASLILTNHSSAYSDQSQLSLFPPMTGITTSKHRW